MKRFMIATALSASMSTAAFAATSAEQAQVEAYLPSIDATALSEDQMTLSLEVIISDMSRAQKLGKLNTILTAGSQMATEAVPTEAQRVEIARYVPDVDFSNLSQAQVDSAMQAITSGDSGSDISGQIAGIFETRTETSVMAMPTEAQRAEIDRVSQGVDYTMLTQAQVDTAMAVINGSETGSDTAARVQTILDTDATPVGAANTASAAEQAILQRYIPDLAVDQMTEAELNTALAVFYSGRNASEIQAQLEEML